MQVPVANRSDEVNSPATHGAQTAVGNLPDLHTVYVEHFDFVWRSLLRLGVSRAAAEDVAQDVFLVVRRRLQDYDGRGSMRAWLFGIARRVASDHRRGAGRAQRRLDLLPSPPPPSGPEEHVSAAEAAELVRRFVDQLDEERRLVFLLSELEGLSGTEISEALGLNRNTVYSRLRKARQKFERAVARELGRKRSDG